MKRLSTANGKNDSRKADRFLCLLKKKLTFLKKCFCFIDFRNLQAKKNIVLVLGHLPKRNVQNLGDLKKTTMNFSDCLAGTCYPNGRYTVIPTGKKIIRSCANGADTATVPGFAHG